MRRRLSFKLRIWCVTIVALTAFWLSVGVIVRNEIHVSGLGHAIGHDLKNPGEVAGFAHRPTGGSVDMKSQAG